MSTGISIAEVNKLYSLLLEWRDIILLRSECEEMSQYLGKRNQIQQLDPVATTTECKYVVFLPWRETPLITSTKTRTTVCKRCDIESSQYISNFSIRYIFFSNIEVLKNEVPKVCNTEKPRGAYAVSLPVHTILIPYTLMCL